MSSAHPTRREQEILSLAFSPAVEGHQPHTFLSLAPTTSASYPSTPQTKFPAPPSPIQTPTQTVNNGAESVTEAVPVVPIGDAMNIDGLVKTRRSSSLSSNGSVQKKRFLKLGPVHGGEGVGQGDWSEEVLEE